MKKVYLAILALVTAVVTVVSSVSVVSAKQLDNGRCFFQSGFMADGIGWLFETSEMFNPMYRDTTFIMRDYYSSVIYYDEVASFVNFKGGLAKFKSIKMDLAFRFSQDPSYIRSQGSHKDRFYWIQYTGPGILNGTFTFNSVAYALTDLSIQNANVYISHDIIK